MRSLLFVLPLFFASFVLADSRKADQQVKDQELMQGTWAVTSSLQDGKEVPTKELAQVRFVITEERIAFGKIGQERMVFNYTLDPAQTPAAIDTNHELDPGKPIVQLGIYYLEGDTLKLSIANAGGARPREFNEKTAATFVLKRVTSGEMKSNL